jgi:regulator of sirC expression with transglutaminase-like and TPR domain
LRYLNVARYLARLDEIAGQSRHCLRREMSAREKITALNAYLFDELGFRGNRDESSDPRNSYLNDVLDRCLGSPIALAIVYIEIGKRLGFPLGGVAMPGHFIVKWKTDDLVILIDVFDEGHVIGQFSLPQPADVQARLSWIQSASPRQILARLLSNLRAIFAQAENPARTLQIVEKLVVLQPNSPDLLREAALLAYRQKSYQRAARFLEAYLHQFPSGRGTEQLRTYLNEVESIVLRLN